LIDPAYSVRHALAPFRRRFIWTSVYFLALNLVGIVGYTLIEGWNWFDAFYMSITTVTAVGYEEVHPLSPPGRVLTTVLIALGITGLGIWWALITALILELDLAGLLRRRRSMRDVAKMSNHFIVCGGGRMGRVVVDEMLHSKRPFVVVDSDPVSKNALLDEHPDIHVIEADATKEQTLHLAGIDKAAGLAACLTNDADNLLLCLTARGQRPDLTIVVRAVDEENIDKLSRAGADHAISPRITGGVRMASMLLRPTVVNFLDVVTTGLRDVTLRLEEAEIPTSSPLAGRSLADAKIPQRTGLIVLALREAETGQITYNPGPETKLESSDVMIVLGREEQVQRLRGYIEKGV
jgi:voltage-gated potassium channel